jgi:hypothetical protein
MTYTPQNSVVVLAGETRSIAIDFSDELGISETMVSAVAGISVWSGIDTNAVNLVLGSPVIYQGTITQLIGGAQPYGFQVGVIYSVWFRAVTSASQTLEGYINVICSSAPPPSFTSNGNTTLFLMNALVASVPSVRRGDAIPSAGFPFINSSGFLVIST